MKVLQTEEETIMLALLSRLERGRFDDAQKVYINAIGLHLVQSITMFRKFRRLQSESVVGAILIERI